jgi:hypothetical protein
MNMKGTATGTVTRKTKRNTAGAPIHSFLLRLGLGYLLVPFGMSMPGLQAAGTNGKTVSRGGC